MIDDPLELMYRALAEPLGIVVAFTGDFQTACQRFYQARVKAADPELKVLQFRRSPYSPENEMWIVKGTKNEQG